MTTLQILRVFLVVSALGGLIFIALRPRTVGSVVGGFLNHRSYAFTLGVLRVLLFTRLYRATPSASEVAALSAAPAKTRNLPPGWGWLGEIVPLFDPGLSSLAHSVFVVTVLLAIFGVATRFTAPIAALVSAYLLGLPNFFSKINHGEHLLVCFCIILAFSRCGDACSVDAVVAGARQRRWSLSCTNTRSLAYGLPIRLCWLVLGLAYFFPGLYKSWNAGDQWIDGTSLLAIAYEKLASLTTYTPTLIIYDSPKLLAFLGIATLVFELGFIFLILSRRFWWLAPPIALSFHVGLAYSIGIVPWSIVKVFWVFLDFGALLYLLRGRLPKRLLELCGIGDEPSTAGAARAQLPISEPTQAVPASATPAEPEAAAAEPTAEPEAAAAEPTAKPEAAAAEPTAEPEAGPSSAAAAKAAAREAKGAIAAPAVPSAAEARKAEPGWSGSATAGGAVIGLMLFTGLAGIDTFPVAVFPRFDIRRGPASELRPARYMLAVAKPDGEPKEVSQKKLPREARRARWDKTLRNLAWAQGAARQSQYRSIEALLRQGGQRFKGGDRLILYREFLSFDPETHARVVVERRVVSEYKVAQK